MKTAIKLCAHQHWIGHSRIGDSHQGLLANMRREKFDRWLAAHDEGQQIKGIQRLLDYRPLPRDVRRYIEVYLEAWAEDAAQQREVEGDR